MAKLFKGILFFMVIILLPVSVLAEKIILVYEPYPPYEYADGGKLIGTDVDIIREVCRRVGCEPEFSERPWKRAMQEVKTGEADGIFSLFKTDEREGFLFFPSDNLSFEKNIVIAKKGKRIKATKLDDLKGKSFGVVVDYAYGDDFDAYKDINKEVCQNNEALLKKLYAGRMEVAIINELVYLSLIKKIGLKGKFEVIYQQSFDPLFVGFSKAKGEKGKKLADDFSKALIEMRKKGNIKKIIGNY